MRQLKIWNDSIIFFVSLFFATFCNYLTEAETQWSYTGENGPSNWGEMCAVGQAQVGIFYEFDWLNWLRLWTLSKAETPLCSFWQNHYDFSKIQNELICLHPRSFSMKKKVMFVSCQKWTQRWIASQLDSEFTSIWVSQFHRKFWP